MSEREVQLERAGGTANGGVCKMKKRIETLLGIYYFCPICKEYISEFHLIAKDKKHSRNKCGYCKTKIL